VIGDRWGVTAADLARRYPCDDVVTTPVVELWRGVTVAARPQAVMAVAGADPAGAVLLRLDRQSGRRSPRELRGLPDPVAGEHFTSVGGRPRGRILSVDPGRQLTLVGSSARRCPTCSCPRVKHPAAAADRDAGLAGARDLHDQAARRREASLAERS
jgi:hypothetical protein